MAETALEESLIVDWTTAIEALDYDSIQELYTIQPQLLWEPLQPLAHLENDFSYFIQRLQEYKILGTSIRPVYALHHILFDYGLPGDEWAPERIVLVDFILKNTKGNELNDCLWGEERNTVMHLAYLLNQPDLTKQLLDKGSLTNIPNNSGHLPTKCTEDSMSNTATDADNSTNAQPEVKLLINKVKSAQQQKVPANSSDRFKRLRELAESPNAKANKPSAERQNSTRRYFRPGHLEERKRRVLSEEEEAELEKQRLKRQKEVELLAQRSAVKNNPLFKKFEEQSQQKDKPVIVSAASAIRDRKKLLGVAEQVRRSSRVINSLKDRSYVSGSVFRQQSADAVSGNMLHVPTLAQLRAGTPNSSDTSPNVSDNEDEDDVQPKKTQTSTLASTTPSVELSSKPESSTLTKEEETATKSIDSSTSIGVSEKIDCATSEQSGKNEIAITTTQPISGPSSTRSPIDQSGATQDEIESLSVGKLSKLNLLPSKSRNTTSKEIDIASNKVKEIVTVHERLNDEEEVEIYSTGRKFTAWKRDDDTEMVEDTKKDTHKNSDTAERKRSTDDPVEQYTKIDKEANATNENTTSSKPAVPARSKSRPTSRKISTKKSSSSKDDINTVDKTLSDKRAIFDKNPEEENQSATPKNHSSTSVSSSDASGSAKQALLSQSSEEQSNIKLQADTTQVADNIAALDTTQVSDKLASFDTGSSNTAIKTPSSDVEKNPLDIKTNTSSRDTKPRNMFGEMPIVDISQKKQMFDVKNNNIPATKSNTTFYDDLDTVSPSSTTANHTDHIYDIESNEKAYGSKDIISRPTSSSSSNSTASSYSNVANTPITSNNDSHFRSADDITNPMIRDPIITETYGQPMNDDANSSKALTSTVSHVLLENRTLDPSSDDTTKPKDLDSTLHTQSTALDNIDNSKDKPIIPTTKINEHDINNRESESSNQHKITLKDVLPPIDTIRYDNEDIDNSQVQNQSDSGNSRHDTYEIESDEDEATTPTLANPHTIPFQQQHQPYNSNNRDVMPTEDVADETARHEWKSAYDNLLSQQQQGIDFEDDEYASASNTDRDERLSYSSDVDERIILKTLTSQHEARLDKLDDDWIQQNSQILASNQVRQGEINPVDAVDSIIVNQSQVDHTDYNPKKEYNGKKRQSGSQRNHWSTGIQLASAAAAAKRESTLSSVATSEAGSEQWFDPDDDWADHQADIRRQSQLPENHGSNSNSDTEYYYTQDKNDPNRRSDSSSILSDAYSYKNSNSTDNTKLEDDEDDFEYYTQQAHKSENDQYYSTKLQATTATVHTSASEAIESARAIDQKATELTIQQKRLENFDEDEEDNYYSTKLYTTPSNPKERGESSYYHGGHADEADQEEGEIVVFMDQFHNNNNNNVGDSRIVQTHENSQDESSASIFASKTEIAERQDHFASSTVSLSAPQQHQHGSAKKETHFDDDDTHSLIKIPSRTVAIAEAGTEQEVVPHDPNKPRVEDISHYMNALPNLGKKNLDATGGSAFDTSDGQENEEVMIKRAISTSQGASAEQSSPAEQSRGIPNAHEINFVDDRKTSTDAAKISMSSLEANSFGKMYIGISGAHHMLLPLPKEITYVRCVISDGEYEYMSRYEILTHQILMDYECCIDTRPGMIITVSLHVRPDYHVKPRTGWSRWFTSIRKQKEHLSGYVHPEDGAIGQTRFAVDHMVPGCYKKTYEAHFDCFNSWYARTNRERARREQFGDDEDFLKIVGKLNVEMLYLPVSNPSVQVPKSLRECDLTLKIRQWHDTCWQSGYLSTRCQGLKVWERHFYRLIGSQLIGYTTEENSSNRQVWDHYNIADVIRLSAAADKVIVTLMEEDTSKVFTESIHTENHKGFFRLTFPDYYLDCVSDDLEESEEWVKTLKSMIGRVPLRLTFSD